jgi:hypothetical protein
VPVNGVCQHGLSALWRSPLQEQRRARHESSEGLVPVKAMTVAATKEPGCPKRPWASRPRMESLHAAAGWLAEPPFVISSLRNMSVAPAITTGISLVPLRFMTKAITEAIKVNKEDADITNNEQGSPAIGWEGQVVNGIKLSSAAWGGISRAECRFSLNNKLVY